MATKLFSDAARHTTLASGISGGASSITVADATGWPSPAAGQEANVAVDYGDQSLVEVGTYTSRSGNTLSGVTGIANAHSAGAKVWHVISAADAARGGNAPTSVAVRKTADESVTSSTTFQNDDHLTFPIAANEVWTARYVLFVVPGDNTTDIKVDFSVPTGCVHTVGGIGIGTSATSQENVTGNYFYDPAGNPLNWGAANGGSILVVEACFVNGGTAGDIVLQWAQNTSSANALTVKARSFLLAHKA